MPELGEIRKGKEISKKDLRTLYSWLECNICNTPRWVRLTNKIPNSVICLDCSRSISGRKNISIARSVSVKKRRGATKCQRGHAFNISNTYIKPNGSRECRICKRYIRQRSDIKLRLASKEQQMGILKQEALSLGITEEQIEGILQDGTV